MDIFPSDADIKKIISEKLQQLREKSQKTLEKTAQELNLDVTQYQRLLKGDRLPRLDTMININKAYNLSLDWWFGEFYGKSVDKSTIINNALITELVENFNNLDSNYQEAVLGMIANLGKNQKRLKKLVLKYK